jgi:Flp pilus assembly pilin Flp
MFNGVREAWPLEEPLMSKLINLLRNDDGQDVIEYALLGAFISIIAIATIKLIGPLVDGIFQDIQTALTP